MTETLADPVLLEQEPLRVHGRRAGGRVEPGALAFGERDAVGGEQVIELFEGARTDDRRGTPGASSSHASATCAMVAPRASAISAAAATTAKLRSTARRL
jgi:hypothetical protein